MFEFIEGIFEELTPSYVIINTSGVGFRVEISLNCYEGLKNKQNGRLFIHQMMREDAHLLFGFASARERVNKFCMSFWFFIRSLAKEIKSS